MSEMDLKMAPVDLTKVPAVTNIIFDDASLLKDGAYRLEREMVHTKIKFIENPYSRNMTHNR